MNNIHIVKDELYYLTNNILDKVFFCGLISPQKVKGIKIAKYFYFHKNKIMSKGEQIGNGDYKIGDKGAGQPVLLYRMASGSDGDYCDLCRYRFYEFGGMIFTIEQFDIMRGHNFYPQIIRDIDKEGDKDENSS